MDLWYWLINDGVSQHKIDKRPTVFLFDVYKQKNSQTNERKTPLDSGERESQFMNQFPDLSQFTGPEPLERRDGQVPLRKDLDKYLNILLLAFLQSFSIGTYSLLEG